MQKAEIFSQNPPLTTTELFSAQSLGRVMVIAPGILLALFAGIGAFTTLDMMYFSTGEGVFTENFQNGVVSNFTSKDALTTGGALVGIAALGALVALIANQNKRT